MTALSSTIPEIRVFSGVAVVFPWDWSDSWDPMSQFSLQKKEFFFEFNSDNILGAKEFRFSVVQYSEVEQR